MKSKNVYFNEHVSFLHGDSNILIIEGLIFNFNFNLFLLSLNQKTNNCPKNKKINL